MNLHTSLSCNLFSLGRFPWDIPNENPLLDSTGIGQIGTAWTGTQKLGFTI
jgi:hypothetical protein